MLSVTPCALPLKACHEWHVAGDELGVYAFTQTVCLRETTAAVTNTLQ